MLSNGIILSDSLHSMYVTVDFLSLWVMILCTILSLHSDLHQINATLATIREALHQARSLGFDRTVILSNKKHVKAITFELQCTAKDGCAL